LSMTGGFVQQSAFCSQHSEFRPDHQAKSSSPSSQVIQFVLRDVGHWLFVMFFVVFDRFRANR